MLSKLAKRILCCMVVLGVACFFYAAYPGTQVFAETEEAAPAKAGERHEHHHKVKKDTHGEECGVSSGHQHHHKEVSDCCGAMGCSSHESHYCCEHHASHSHHVCKPHHCCEDHTCSAHHHEKDISVWLGLAYRAKKELLKEKMKARIEAKVGDKMDKVADLLVEAMFEEYREMRADKEKRRELKEKIREIFTEKKEEPEKD